MYKFKFTLDEIEDVAKSLINKINGVNIILLKGELGTGKTTLIKSGGRNFFLFLKRGRFYLKCLNFRILVNIINIFFLL